MPQTRSERKIKEFVFSVSLCLCGENPFTYPATSRSAARWPSRRCRRSETLDDVAFLVHQELREVPLDAIAQQATLFALQKLEDRMRVVAVDLDLREQRKVHAVIDLAEGLDLVIGPGLLMAELVARKAEHLQAAVLVLGIKRLQALVLRREPALAGGVDDQQDLALVIAELLVPAII